MTREKAINIISQMIKDEEEFLSDGTVEAHKMAIKALEQEPILDKIRAEIDGIEINGQIDEHTMFVRSGKEVKKMALGIINKHIGAEMESSDEETDSN